MAAISYSSGAILEETIRGVRSALGDTINDLTVEQTVVGVFFTGVKLNNGHGGICFTPIKALPDAVCCPNSARAVPAAGQLKGSKAIDVLEDMFTGKPLKKALGIAVLNALSSTCWEQSPPQGYIMEAGVDVLDEVEIPLSGYTVVVGALVPIIRMLKERKSRFAILELDPATLKPHELPYYIPAARASEVVPKADLVVITGTTLINDTLEGLLSLAKPETDIIVVGPTSSMLPEAFFRRGVRLVGGTLVTKPDELLHVLAEAGSGYHIYGRAAEKVVFRRKSA